MPQFDISPRDRKLQRLQTLQQMNAQGTQNTLAQQNAMLQQLLQLYGIQEQVQMAPEKLRAAELANAGTAQQQEYLPKEYGLKERELAQREEALRAKTAGAVTPQDLLQAAGYGVDINSLDPSLLTPELRASHEHAAKAKATQDWWNVIEDVKQGGNPSPEAMYAKGVLPEVAASYAPTGPAGSSDEPWIYPENLPPAVNTLLPNIYHFLTTPPSVRAKEKETQQQKARKGAPFPASLFYGQNTGGASSSY